MPANDDLLAVYAEPLRPGDKLRFCGTRPFWFADVIANAERSLRIGEVYTLKTIRAYSSWTEITLEETGATPYNDTWFEPFPAKASTKVGSPCKRMVR